MRRHLAVGIFVACLAGFGIWIDNHQKGNSAMAAAALAKSDQLVVHNVYFTLLDSTPANRDKLVAACRKYLVNHPGVAYFACGTVVPDLDREVNVRDWDVGLHIVFDSRASHDRYQTAPDHLKFIEENKPTWKQVRVFDTDGEQSIPK